MTAPQPAPVPAETGLREGSPLTAEQEAEFRLDFEMRQRRHEALVAEVTERVLAALDAAGGAEVGERDGGTT
jgi:hypothetical protein